MDQYDPPISRSAISMAISWSIIAAIIILILVLNQLATSAAVESKDDPVGVTIMRLQARYLVGVKAMTPAGAAEAYGTATTFNTGTIPQRLRFVVLAGELVGPEEALNVLDELAGRIEEEPDLEVTAEQVQIIDILRRLYTQYAAGEYEATTLDEAERAMLVRELDWFGELALAPDESPEEQARREVIAPAMLTMVTMVVGLVMGALVGLAGLVMLILMLVWVFTRRVRSRLGGSLPYGHIYLETFAVWMILFIGLSTAVEALHAPQLLGGAMAGFLSLTALAWPVFRGLPWRQVRSDIGWTLGEKPVLEPFIGLGCYAMAIPLLGIGLILTFVLMQVQGIISPQPPLEDHFGPTGGPAHPIIQFIGQEGLWRKVQILILASVAAPIVEETMFRGVFYRHLRSATERWGMAISILFSAAFSGIIFAMIHPQGWVAIPALCSLAIAMSLAREWRGTLIPSMVMHGTSNGLVMLFLMLALGG